MMNKLYVSILFLFVAFTSNAQQYPSIQDLKTKFEIVSDYIESDIKFIENNANIKLNTQQKKDLNAIFYNKYKYVSGSENLNDFEGVANSTAERLSEIIGKEGVEKLALIENSMLILSGRIYLNPEALN